MSQIRPTTAMENNACPLNDSNIDVIPESYHYSSRCLCFMCKCGLHICPSEKRTLYTKDSFKSSYKRCYSRPSMTPVPQRVKTMYHKNNQKMDLETEYMKKYPGFTIENVSIPQSTTPQPSLKFDGSSQYNRDFPNWGPVNYHHTKRPVYPIHETKLKFEGMSSYEYFYQPSIHQSRSRKGSINKMNSLLSNDKKFKLPMQSSSQRDYQKISKEHFPPHEQKKIEGYVPLYYNPNQFKTTTHTSYIKVVQLTKDPVVIRKQALINGK
jgi:hypothetical protein